MTVLQRSIVATTAFTLLSASMIAAQSASAPSASQPPASTTAAQDSRPATTTFNGGTGLWFVPTGEVLGKGKWSVSGYRRGTNWVQGYTNVADFAGTFGYGLGGMARFMGALLVVTGGALPPTECFSRS